MWLIYWVHQIAYNKTQEVNILAKFYDVWWYAYKFKLNDHGDVMRNIFPPWICVLTIYDYMQLRNVSLPNATYSLAEKNYFSKIVGWQIVNCI